MTSPDFIISRTLNAPRALVWKLHTDPQHLQRWFGPKGFPMTQCKMDLRVGGTFLYCLRSAEGFEMWGKWTFREIVAPARLAVVVSFSDAAGGITRHPMAPDWPLETYGVTTFEEQGDKTVISVRWSALNATAAEQAAFDAGHEGMNQGWSGTMELLEEYIAGLK